MIGWRSTRNGDAAQSLLGILGRHGTYDERLEDVLAHVSQMTALANTYLYIVHAGARHLHLARSRVTTPGMPADHGGAILGDAQEGGTAWSVVTPPFELRADERYERPRVADSPVGPLLSLPLHTSDGTLVGVVQAGPLADSGLPKATAARHAEVEATIALVVAAAIREEASRRRAELAEAKLEGTRRLAGSALDAEQFIGLLLELALSSTQTEAGFVAITERGASLRIVGHRGLDDAVLAGISLDPEDGLFDWSLGDLGGSLVVRDVETATLLGIRSVLAVPLFEGEERLGIFALLNFGDAGTFGEQSLELLSTFADQIRLMIHKARTFAAFSERFIETVIGLAGALDAARPGQAEHHQRVSSVGRTLAVRLGLDQDEVDAIATAGLIHDVGMIASGSGEHAYEFDIQHPAVGASLVEHLPLHRSVANAVACHHEWFDGWGFPEGLVGRMIPRAGRVLAMAEFLVEMSTPDVVRPAWTAEKLADEVRQRRGSQFDPEVADLALELVDECGSDFLDARMAVHRPATEG